MATKLIDLGESVAGEEDPGASIDMPLDSGGTPAVAAEDRKPGDETACPSCGGNGQLGGRTCPECEGTGRIVVGIGGA